MAEIEPAEPAAEAGSAEEPRAAAAQPEPEPAEDDGAAPIDPGSLRVDPRVAREMFGDLYTETTAHGPTQLGSNNTMHNYLGERPLDPIISELPGIEDLMAVYAATDADGQLDDLLAQRSSVCLAGPRNSGRFSTARAALRRRYKAGHVYEIAMPTDVRPEVLVDKPSRLKEDSGYVLRLPGGGHVDVMRKLGGLFRQRHSTLFLIRDEEPRPYARHSAEVRHSKPDPVEVFRNHLAWLLRDEGPDVADSYLSDEVRVALEAVYGPRESVAVATAIAKERPVGEAALHDILERSQPKRRERAVEILLPGKGEAAARARRAGQHARAFRLSYAVFARRPLHYVFDAAELLLREIDSAALRPDWGSMALQHSVQSLLGEKLEADWAAGRGPGKATLGASRTAWIQDPGLRGAIIDVAWHDFDGTRKSLLNWLDRLVTDGDEVMRRAAAETAGLLVHYDFQRVHKDLVDVWAASPKAHVRQAAAWTMTLSDMPDDVRPRVRAKLSEWCSGASNYRRDTAARVYASGLEQDVLAWSMLDLARIAGNRYQKQRRVVAEAVYQLYRPERAGWILAELGVWAGNPLLRVHAARALVILAARVEPDAPDGRPDLLDRLAQSSVDVGQLGRVWLVALVDSATGQAAANVLARWIRHAEADDELRRAVVALLEAIGTAPATRRRIAFHLRRTFEFADGLPDWIGEPGRRAS